MVSPAECLDFGHKFSKWSQGLPRARRNLCWFNTPGCSEPLGNRRRRSACAVTPPCGLSLPSSVCPADFFDLLRQFSSLCLWFQSEIAVPAQAVSQCGGGHGEAAGCEQLLHPSVAERRCFFCVGPQGIPESSSLSWPECGRTSSYILHAEACGSQTGSTAV
jgi:hypothetical protein